MRAILRNAGSIAGRGLKGLAPGALIVGAICGPTSATVADGTIQDSEWHLTLRQSGGIAGIDQELRLTSAGDVRATDRRGQRQKAERLPPDELSRIAALVGRAPAPDSRVPRLSSCRDCFQYDLEIESGSVPRSFHLDEMSLTGSQLEPLVSDLSRLLTRTLSRQPFDQ